MLGWGNVFGFVFDLFGSKSERRRNEIDKLEKRQKYIEKNLDNNLVDEYDRNKRRLEFLYEQAKNT